VFKTGNEEHLYRLKFNNQSNKTMNQTYFKKIHLSIVLAFFITLSTGLSYGQKNVKSKTTSNFVSDSLFNALKWRNIGPFRSGRSLAVAGHANHPLTYYFGATGGGVWKTIDGGNEWFPISDSFFKII
jgi:hypothetical protein